MRKFYFTIMTVLFALVSMTASAATYDLPEGEDAILASEAYGMKLTTAYNFVGWTVNGEAIGGDGFTFGDQNPDMPLMNLTAGGPFAVTNSGLENMWCQGTYLRKSANGMDTSGQSGPRWIGYSNMRKGQIIVVQATVGWNKGEEVRYNDENGNNEFIICNAYRYNVSGDWQMHFYNEYEQPMQVEIITDEIHALQNADLEEGQDSKADGFFYFRVLQDGPVYIMVGRNAVVQGIQIWSPNDEPEFVNAPTCTVAETNGSAREIVFKTSPTNYGNPTYVFYSVDGEMPIALTEEGLLDVENTFGSLDDIPDGYIGDGMPAESGVYVHVDANDDESSDGVEDNIVTVKAVAVSSTGVISEIVDLKVDVSYIQLNAPTLTLVGFDGTERLYKVNWTSNVGNDVEYTVTYEADGNSAVEISVGDVISFSQNVVVTVSAGNAYEDGVCTQDADVPGIVFKRKFTPGYDDNQEPLHDWDFQNLTEEALSMIKGQVIDHYAILDDNGAEIETYTVEQYENKEYPEGADLKPIQKYFGWDSADSRNTNRHWRTWIPTYETDGEGNPTETIASSVYAEDETGMFHDLVVDNSHSSYSTIAIFTNQSGLFFMNRGTINVQPVQYGEYVVLNTNGGTTVTKSEASATGCELSIGQSVYVYNIDIYTYDELPEVPEELVAVEGIAAKTAKSRGTYNVAGQRVNAGYKGFVIKNGRVVYQK